MASMGTSFTDEQVAVIARTTDKLTHLLRRGCRRAMRINPGADDAGRPAG
ncbi:hypothetical protein ACW2AE_03975 [Limosilactobacillus fermentum]